MDKIEAKIGENGPIVFNNKAATKARNKFVRGPARATNARSFLPSRSIIGLTGTGFAAPKMIGDPDITRSKGTRIVMMGSMWGIGLSVILPARRAVGSPRRSATTPCIISCKIAEAIRTISPTKSMGI